MTMLYVLLAVLVGATASLILWATRILYAVLGLLGVLLGMAGLFFLQGASFVAVAQILLYGSGVLLLLLCSTLMLPPTLLPSLQRPRWMQAGLVMVLVGLCLGPMVRKVGKGLEQQGISYTGQADAVTNLGFQLMGPYALVFEWIGLILLIALVGAIALIEPPNSTRKNKARPEK